MREEAINKKTKRLLSAIARSGLIKDFYLAGGTALALQYGHRKSVDLDWFSRKSFDTAKLKKDLSGLGKIIVSSDEKDTLNLSIGGVKASFMGYPYKLIFPLLSWQGVKLADQRDIACMKLDAMSSRGSKKDFIDLYFFLKNYSFAYLLNLFENKYMSIKYNKLHILKSLTYFTDADSEPMPIMIQEISWREVKKYFQKISKNILK
ncbi:MAG: nucleotidyl transferase AbiEii/AbiGii toxin family protein [Candidatus Falkowbacteria bacterium]